MNYILMLVLFLFIHPVFSGELGDVQAVSNGVEAKEEKRKTVLLFPQWEADLNVDDSFKKEIINRLNGASARASRFKLMQTSQFINDAFSGVEPNLSELTRDKLIEKSRELGIDEVLLVTRVSFSQIGVAPEEDEKEHNEGFWAGIFLSIFEGLLSGPNEATAGYPNNILTELSVNIERINVSDSAILDNVYYENSYIGGNRAYSKSNAMDLFDTDFINKIASLYTIEGIGYAESHQYLLIKKGKLDGVKPNTIFNIVEHDKSIMLGGEKVGSPGKRIGIAKAINVLENSSRLKIVRQWGHIKETSKIAENKGSIYSINLFAAKNIDNATTKFGFEAMFDPFSTFDYGFGLQYARTVDTRNELSQGLSVDFIAALNFLRSDIVSMSLQSGGSLNLLFRTDDVGESVSSAIFGVPVFLNIERKFNKSWNGFVSFGYLFSNKNSTWDSTKDTGKRDSNGDPISTNIPAVWNGPAPVIDVSGAYIKLGMKKYVF